MSSAIEQAIQSNRQYTSSFNLGSLKAPPQKHLAIVTCMDARVCYDIIHNYYIRVYVKFIFI